MIEVIAPKWDMIEQADEPPTKMHAPRWHFPKESNALKPEVRCNCGEWVTLTDFHIAVDGFLTPSFLHEKCGWHVILQLGEWLGQEFLAGEE